MACIARMELATELDQIESDIAQVGNESIEDVLVDAATEELNAAVSSTIEGGDDDDSAGGDDDASAGPGSQKQKQTTKKKKK